MRPTVLQLSSALKIPINLNFFNSNERFLTRSFQMNDLVSKIYSRNLRKGTKIILQRLDEKSLINFGQVCQTWRDLIEESRIWDESYEKLVQSDFFARSLASRSEPSRPKKSKFSKKVPEPTALNKFWTLKG